MAHCCSQIWSGLQRRKILAPFRPKSYSGQFWDITILQHFYYSLAYFLHLLIETNSFFPWGRIKTKKNWHFIIHKCYHDKIDIYLVNLIKSWNYIYSIWIFNHTNCINFLRPLSKFPLHLTSIQIYSIIIKIPQGKISTSLTKLHYLQFLCCFSQSLVMSFSKGRRVCFNLKLEQKNCLTFLFETFNKARI